MRPHTEKLRLEILDSVARARELVRRAGEPALRKQPEEGGWSAAECLEHLTLSTESFTRKLRRALDAAVTRPARGQETTSWLGRILLWHTEPPVRKKDTAPEKFHPTVPASRDVLLARFEKAHRELIQLIEETDGIDRMRVKVPYVAVKWIRITLLDAFTLLSAHDRRHLWQAERACAGGAGAYNPPA